MNNRWGPSCHLLASSFHWFLLKVLPAAQRFCSYLSTGPPPAEQSCFIKSLDLCLPGLQHNAWPEVSQFSSVQSLSHVRLFVTPWITARQASLSITNSRSSETHVHRVGDAIQPFHPLSSPSPPAPNPSQHQSLFQWVNSSALMSPNICCMSDGMNETVNPLLSFCTVLSVCCMNSHTLPCQCGVSITGAPEKSLALHFYNLHCPLASETVPHGPS